MKKSKMKTDNDQADLPELETTDESEPNLIRASDPDFSFIVMKLLGLGLTPDLIAKAIAADSERFSHPQYTSNIEKYSAIICAAISPVQRDFAADLKASIDQDILGETKAPWFSWRSRQAIEPHTTSLVHARRDDKSALRTANRILDSAVAIGIAEKAFPLLTEEAAEIWRSKISWTVNEFAALSMGRKPLINILPKAPKRSEMGKILSEYRHRLDQLNRAVLLGKDEHGFIPRNIAPADAFRWAVRTNAFHVSDMIRAQPQSNHSAEEIDLFVRTVVKESRVGTGHFKFRVADLEDLIREGLPRLSETALKKHLWPKLPDGIKPAAGRKSGDYQTNRERIRRSVLKILQNAKRN
jgi:hypothetical protein